MAILNLIRIRPVSISTISTSDDVNITNITTDDILSWNGVAFVNTPKPKSNKKSFIYSYGVDSDNVVDRYLDKVGNFSSNLSPHIAFVNSKIQYISFSVSNPTNEWNIEIEINGVIVTTLNALSTAESGVSVLLNIDVLAGDKIVAFANTNNNEISYPSVDLFLEEVS